MQSGIEKVVDKDDVRVYIDHDGDWNKGIKSSAEYQRLKEFALLLQQMGDDPDNMYYMERVREIKEDSGCKVQLYEIKFPHGRDQPLNRKVPKNLNSRQGKPKMQPSAFATSVRFYCTVITYPNDTHTYYVLGGNNPKGSYDIQTQSIEHYKKLAETSLTQVLALDTGEYEPYISQDGTHPMYYLPPLPSEELDNESNNETN